MSSATQTRRFASPYSMRDPTFSTHGASQLQQRLANDLGISLMEISQVNTSLATDDGLRKDLARLTGDLCRSVYKDTEFTARAKFDSQLNNVFNSYAGAIDNMRFELDKASTEQERSEMLNSMRAQTVAFATRVGQELTKLKKADESRDTFATGGSPSYVSLPMRERQRQADLLTEYPRRPAFGDGRFFVETTVDGTQRYTPLAANPADLKAMLQDRSRYAQQQTASQAPTLTIIVVSTPASSLPDSAVSTPEPYNMFSPSRVGPASSFRNSVRASYAQRNALADGFASFIGSQRASPGANMSCETCGSTLAGRPSGYVGSQSLVSVA